MIDSGLTGHASNTPVMSCTSTDNPPNAMTAMPSAPTTTDDIPTWFNRYRFHQKMSINPIISRLKRLLPNAPPTARSGSPRTATALTPVPSSGSDVAVASRTTPTNVRPSPVLIAITSADFARNSEAPSITTVATPSCAQRIAIVLPTPVPAEPVTPFHAANHPPPPNNTPYSSLFVPSPLSDLRALRGST